MRRTNSTALLVDRGVGCSCVGCSCVMVSSLYGVALVEVWELQAREAIRDLVARYNANGDTGRFAHVMELFAPDAEMNLDGASYRGHDEILGIFTGTRNAALMARSDSPRFVRHFTSTHQIDMTDHQQATGRCYFQVLTAIGLDHWGRYIDGYRQVDGAWRFASRQVLVDGYAPGSLFSQNG
jgi:hypothetical protein